MSKLFLNPSTKYVPQMDLRITGTENGGIEATQTFLVRKSDISKVGLGNLALFARGTRWEQIFPEVPQLWANLTIKTVGEGSDYAPGVISLSVSFTGYSLSDNGSSGEEPIIPTTSLRGNLQEGPLVESKAWQDLSDASKARLGVILTGRSSAIFNMSSGVYGYFDDTGEVFTTLSGAFWAPPTGDELTFARMITQGKTTCPLPSWNYNYRTESKTGFTAAQLNALGKIVENPPGNPTKPSSEWTWLLIGPDQSQSGPERYIKELSFQLIRDTDENQMLHGS